MKRREGRMWAAVTLALAVSVGAGAILPGCNGSNDNGGPSMATQFNNVALTLKNGQTLTLNLSGDDDKASGTVTVPTILQPLQTKRVTFHLPSGIYDVSGKFSPPRSFSVAGIFPAPIGRFSIGGVLPTATEAGNFRITVNGQSESGVIPALGGGTPTGTLTATPSVTPSASASPTRTATATPTATTTASTGDGLSSITFTNDQANAAPPPSGKIAQSSGFVDVAGGRFSAIFQDTQSGITRAVSLEPNGQGALAPGKTYTLPGTNGINYYQNGGGLSNANWDSTGGTLTIIDVRSASGGQNSVIFSISNATFAPRAGSTSTGTFTLTARGQVTGAAGGG